MPPRILYVTPRYLPERGGTEIHTSEVATRMRALGADVEVLTADRTRALAAVDHDDGVVVRRVPAWPRGRDYFIAPSLARAIRSARPDLVHVQSYHTFVAPTAMLTALRAGLPYVVTLHSGGHSSSLRVRLRPTQARVLRGLMLRSRAIVAVSSFEAELFSRRLRTPRARFAVIPSGVDLPPVPSPTPAVDPDLLLSLGRVEDYKGHHRVVEALAVLRRTRPGVRLRIVGSGPQEEQLRRLATDLGIADAVEIAPVADGDREAIARLLAQAAVVVALSEYESQGLAVQEAIGIGRPVVVGKGTALDELSERATIATVAEDAGPGDIAQSVRAMMGVRVARPPALQTWDDCVAALSALYERILR